MASLFGAIQWVQDQMLAVSGIKSAPDYPSSGMLPIVITHLSDGEFHAGDPLGCTKEMVNIAVELHISAQGAGDAGAFKTLETLHPLIKAKLLSGYTLGGNVQTFERVTFVTGRGVLDGVNVISRIYTITNVKFVS